MDNFNKIISFVLGLVVVVVFIAILSGKLSLGSKISSLTKGGALSLGGNTTPTPTSNPRVTPSPSPIQRLTINTTNNYKTQPKPTTSVQGVNTIPSTGVPTFFIPTVVSALFGGVFLRRTGKK